MLSTQFSTLLTYYYNRSSTNPCNIILETSHQIDIHFKDATKQPLSGRYVVSIQEIMLMSLVAMPRCVSLMLHRELNAAGSISSQINVIWCDYRIHIFTASNTHWKMKTWGCGETVEMQATPISHQITCTRAMFALRFLEITSNSTTHQRLYCDNN